MTPGQYILYRAQDHHWAVHYQGRFLAKFPDKSQAIQAAITIAQETLEPDQDASVVCEGPGGERYTIWMSGRDSFVANA